jgi:RNA polymerase primary sigma factor
MIKLPTNKVNEVVQIEKARNIVQSRQGAEGEIKEIAGFLGVDAGHVAEIINISHDMMSLDNPVNFDPDSATVGDFIEDKKYTAPEEYAVNTILQDDIETLLKGLDSREADILRFRYGLGDNAAMSLKEIGDRFNLTKERVRQIENKALKRLQQPSRRRLLANYVA